MAWHAFGLAQALGNKSEDFRVFFYQDGVQVANDLQWFPDDQRNLKQEWQKLGIRLPVCVSAALARESLMQAMPNVIHFNNTT
jgi:tRNA 2-thiouridine synthesizing protein D